MELIYTNRNREDIGYLKNFNLDMVIGDTNDFELTASRDSGLSVGSIVYCENTQYGGIIDGFKFNTKEDESITYFGRTFQGVLANRYYFSRPPIGEYTIVNFFTRWLTLLNLTDYFDVIDYDGGSVYIRQSEIELNIYEYLTKYLALNGYKLIMGFKNGKITIGAKPIVDFSESEEFDETQIKFDIIHQVNGLRLLSGTDGALTNIVYVSLNDDGTIGRGSSGIENKLDIIESRIDVSPNERDGETVLSMTESYLNECINSQVEINVEFDVNNEDIYDVGDIIGVHDPFTDAVLKQVITRKVIKGSDNDFEVSVDVESLNYSTDKYKGIYNKSDTNGLLNAKVSKPSAMWIGESFSGYVYGGVLYIPLLNIPVLLGINNPTIANMPSKLTILWNGGTYNFDVSNMDISGSNIRVYTSQSLTGWNNYSFSMYFDYSIQIG